MKYNELKKLLERYNLDGGFNVPLQILNDPECDLALALEIFYYADGYAYLENRFFNSNLEKWSLFVTNLYNDILNGKYQKTDKAFKIPLTKVQKYKLNKKQIPEIFLTDLDGFADIENLCEQCGLWKSKATDLCPECHGIMDLEIEGLSLSWNCRNCDFSVATTANKLCFMNGKKYPKECYEKLSECPYSEQIK